MSVQRLVAAAELAEVVAFQNVEHLDQRARRRRRAAASRRCRSRDRCRAPAARSMRAVILQIVRRHDAAGAAHRGGDLARRCGLGRRRAGRPAAMACKRVGEIELHQPVAFVQRRRRPLREDRRRRRPARQPLAARAAASRRCRPRPESPARQSDRRRDQLGERELAGAVFLLRQREARDRAGHADGKRRYRATLPDRDCPAASRNMVGVAAAGAVSR